MRHILQHLLLWAVLVSVLTACAGLADNENRLSSDVSLRTLQPCAPPCWHNIVPGHSHAADVRQILPTLPFVNAQSIEEHPDNTVEGGYSFRWLYIGSPGPFGSIQLRNDVVTRIAARPGFELRLREVVDSFGPPDRVLPNNLVMPDGGYYTVSLYYPDKGLVFDTPRLPHLGYDAKEYHIQPDLPVGFVYYSAPATLEQLIIYVHEIRPEQVASVLERTYPWQGFGTFLFSAKSVP